MNPVMNLAKNAVTNSAIPRTIPCRIASRFAGLSAFQYSLPCALLGLSLLLVSSNIATAQHSLINSRMPPGELGRFKVGQRPELSSVMQPVLLKAPRGASVAVAEGAGFSYGEKDATLVSMQVGETYRLKVSNIPLQYGDVYPSVELIDRMHAPAGKETRYPIPIDITAEELAMALRGKYVTRVIYVEDPRQALGVRQLPDERLFFEVMAHEDPLHVASRLGRPVAILRMGSLAPGSNGPSSEFLFGSPVVQRHAIQHAPVPYKPRKLKPSDLPTKPLQRDELTEPQGRPDTEEDDVNIPEDLPEKKDVPEQPADNNDLFDDGGGDVFDPEPGPAGGADADDGLGGDLFDEPSGDEGVDPFGETDVPSDDSDPFGDI